MRPTRDFHQQASPRAATLSLRVAARASERGDSTGDHVRSCASALGTTSAKGSFLDELDRFAIVGPRVPSM
jgi:hypothetical protein